MQSSKMSAITMKIVQRFLNIINFKIVCSLASFFASQIILLNLIHKFVWCFVDNIGLFDFDFRS